MQLLLATLYEADNQYRNHGCIQYLFISHTHCVYLMLFRVERLVSEQLRGVEH